VFRSWEQANSEAENAGLENDGLEITVVENGECECYSRIYWQFE